MGEPVIAFDARMRQHAGIGRYIRELTQALSPAPAGFQFQFLEGSAKVYGLGEQWELPRLARGADLLHVPHFNVPLLWKKPMVVTVHDLTYFHDGQASHRPFAKTYAAYFLKHIAKNASAVLTVSEYTKKDLIGHFPGLGPEKVFVSHEAASKAFKPVEDQAFLKRLRDEHGLQKPFVLYVGSLKAHKNLPALIQAVSGLRDRKMDLELVIVGKKDPRETKLLTLVHGRPFVRYLGELPDEALAGLYTLAEAFVLPSFREGFGLPVLEAMACGAPVLVSDNTSLPEVGGAAVRMFDPGSIDALLELLYNVLSDSELRKKMRAAGLQRAKEFSWEKTAKKTLEVYRCVLRMTG